MLIQPYIVTGTSSKTFLSHRELRCSSDGFAVTRYKRKLYYVTSEFEIILNGNTPPQIGYLFLTQQLSIEKLRFVSSQLEGSFQNSGVSKKLIFPTTEFLMKMAFDGIDESFLCLKLLRHDNDQEAAFSKAGNFRIRYGDLNSLNYSEIRARLEKVLFPDETFLSLRAQFFAFPYQNSKYLKELKKIQNFCLKDYLKPGGGATILAEIGMDKEIFRTYFEANIFFHHCIYSEDPLGQVESDILSYKNNQQDCHDELKVSLRQGFDFLTKECEVVIKSWKKLTKTKIIDLCEDLPRRSRLTKSHVSIFSPKFPINLKNLSILTVASVTYDAELASRLYKLHSLGLRKVGQLTYL